VTSLVGSSFGVLDECSLCKRKTINSSAFLAEQLFPCLVHTLVCAELLKGNFVVKKSKCAFSAVATDQAREQNNASVK